MQMTYHFSHVVFSIGNSSNSSTTVAMPKHHFCLDCAVPSSVYLLSLIRLSDLSPLFPSQNQYLVLLIELTKYSLLLSCSYSHYIAVLAVLHRFLLVSKSHFS